jgi:hypothetical protein
MRRLNSSIKIGLDIIFSSGNWIELAEDKVQWQALILTVIKVSMFLVAALWIVTPCSVAVGYRRFDSRPARGESNTGGLWRESRWSASGSPTHPRCPAAFFNSSN